MAREAEQTHHAAQRARRETQRRLMELRLFCAANDIDFAEIRTEAKNGHGQDREAQAS